MGFSVFNHFDIGGSSGFGQTSHRRIRGPYKTEVCVSSAAYNLAGLRVCAIFAQICERGRYIL